jgi:hypothetical protein
MDGLVLLAIALAVAFATGMIASIKNRNALDLGFYSLFFFPIPLIIIVALLPKLPPKAGERC